MTRLFSTQLLEELRLLLSVYNEKIIEEGALSNTAQSKRTYSF